MSALLALPALPGSEVAAPTRGTGAELHVDLDAVAHNTAVLASRTDAALMAVVKADGFGHGAAAVARTALAHGASSLGVTSIDEALALRAAGVRAPVLSWLNPVDADVAAARAADVQLAVGGRALLDAVATQAPGSRVHLQLDTGMARDGASPQEWASLCRAARVWERRGALEVVGVMGHLPCGEDPTSSSSRLGRERFTWGLGTARAAGLRPQVRHLATTAATLADRASHHDLVRVGAGLVGIDPTGAAGLRPALRLTTPLISVRDVVAGTGVGYGHTWTAPRATTLGLLGLGYADGIPRAASSRGEVSVRGRRCQVVGRVSMDMTVVDLGPALQAGDRIEPGESVTVLGADGAPTPREWAAWADCLEHEILTGIGPRVRRAAGSLR